MQYKQISITKIYIYILTIIDTILTFTAIVDYLWLLCTHDCLCKSYVFRYWILYLNCFMFLQNRHLKAESISNLTLFVDTICQIIRSILVTILYFLFLFFLWIVFLGLWQRLIVYKSQSLPTNYDIVLFCLLYSSPFNILFSIKLCHVLMNYHSNSSNNLLCCIL